MAIGALARRCCVGTGQHEPRAGVVELAIAPLRRIMALLASRREAVVRYGGRRAGEILLVARNACGCSQVVIVVDVAIYALPGWNRMSAGQKESRCVVIKLRVEPVIGGVASFAIRRELGRNVVRIVCLRKVRLVAGVARRGHDLELTGCPAFVAGVAIDRSMSACQRESVVMLLHVFDRNLPAPNGVALLAIGSELALMDVCVAVLTTSTDIRKDHLYVAGSARHGRVHTS